MKLLAIFIPVRERKPVPTFARYCLESLNPQCNSADQDAWYDLHSNILGKNESLSNTVAVMRRSGIGARRIGVLLGEWLELTER